MLAVDCRLLEGWTPLLGTERPAEQRWSQHGLPKSSDRTPPKLLGSDSRRVG
jgi:hypothetical protein